MSGYIRFASDALGIEPSYDVLVDATTVGDVSKLNTVDDSEAAAITSPVVNFAPDRPSRLPASGSRSTRDRSPHRRGRVGDAHELTHYLTLRRLGAAPTWVKEGIAEWVSTAPAGLEGLVAPADLVRHAQQVEHRLPTSGRWGLDPKADYLIGRAAVTYLVQTYGVATVFEMGRAYARIAGDDPDEKTPRVLQRVVGIGEADLVRATWAEIDSLHTS